MKYIISMALLMLSFSCFGSELSTLTTYVKYGKELSPTFYEDVMSNLKKIKDVCESAPQAKERLISDLTETPVTTKEYVTKKEQLEQLSKSVDHALKRQINKLAAAKKHLMFTPSCLSEDIGLSIFGFAKMTGLMDINEQFISAMDYLEDGRSRVDEISWAKGYERGSVTKKEKETYQFCSSQLTKILEGVEYE